MLSDEFIRRIPKSDVHVHLDGSIRLSTLIELAKERGVDLPAFTEEGLKETVFKDHYADLNEYLSGFAWTTSVLQDAEALHRVAYELAFDNFNEGVIYVEVRFAPQLHINDNLTFNDVMKAVDGGLKSAREEINRSLPAGHPRFEYGIIVCAMRYFNQHFSSYYRRLTDVLSYSSEQELFTMASLELARATVQLRRDTDVQIVAFDLAGSEHGYPAGPHQAAFNHVHRNFLKKTVHAGEAYGPESIFQAITKLHADRIGHGLRLFDSEMIHSTDIDDKDRYIDELANFIADKRVTIEVCLTSNMQTSPDLQEVRNHSLAKMLERNMSLTFCTDNRLVSNTTVSDEIRLALDNFRITPKQLKNFIIYGFKRSFHYKPYADKRRYVRQVIDHYESIEQEHGINTPAS
jgi:adenosine deaminase